MKMTKNQSNDLVRCLIDGGLSPLDFSKKEMPHNFQETVVYEYTKKIPPPQGEEVMAYFFQVIYDHHDYSIKYKCYPSRIGPNYFGEMVMGWEGLIDEFKTWIQLLLREIDEPDLWDLYQKDTELAMAEAERVLGIKKIPESLDRPLSVSEAEEFSEKSTLIIDEIKAQLGNNPGAMERIAAATEMIAENTKRRPKSAIASGLTFLSVLLLTEMAKDAAKDINAKIRTYLVPLIWP